MKRARLAARACGLALLGLGASLALPSCGHDSEPSAPPARLLPADSEAQLAEREARAFEPAPGPPPAPSPAPAPAASAAETGLTISARALDEAAHPIADARLTWLALAPDFLPEPRRSARSDANGTVWLKLDWDELDSTQPLLLTLVAAGHARVDLRLEPARWMAGPLVNLGEVELAPGGALAGRVLDARGQGVPGAVVALALELDANDVVARAMARVWPLVAPPTPGAMLLVRSGAQGEFTLEGAPLGRLALVAARFGGPDALLPARVEGLDVRTGETVRAPDLVLAPARAEELVRGRVLAPDGAPLAGIWIALGQAEGGDIYEGRTFTDADGRFALPALTDTVFRVLAMDAKGRWPQAEARDVRAGAPEVELRFESPH